MAIFLFVCAGVGLIAAIQERKDTMRCIGFTLFAIIAAVTGAAVVANN